MKNLIWIFLLSFASTLNAQMPVGGTILYGNEWIDYTKTYFKISIDEDGLYRVSRAELSAAGLDVNSANFDHLRMFNYGKEVPFFVGPNDSYIEFVGERNKSQVDQFVYRGDSTIFNPEYSAISDISAYFITTGDSPNPLVYNQIVTDLSSNTLSPEPFYMHTEKVVLNNNYYKPVLPGGDEVRFSNMVGSEGFGGILRASNSIDIPVSNVLSTGPQSSGYIRYGGNGVQHYTRISVEGQEIKIDTTLYSDTKNIEFDYPSENIDNTLTINLDGTASTSDKNIISVAALTYPRQYEIILDSHFVFHRRADLSNHYVELAGYNIQDIPIVYDVENRQRIIPEKLGNGVLGLITSPNDKPRDLVLFSEAKSMKSAIKIERRDFVNYLDDDYDYLLVSNEALNGSNGNIDQYADYRSSDMGGNYKPLVAYVDQLYDQFAYGVDYHFIALQNFGFWAHKNYSDVKFMFILGKGRQYQSHRTQEQKDVNEFVWVPTFGNPGSDNLLLSPDSEPLPLYPVGRLAAKNAQEIEDYLNKVKDHDLNKLSPNTIEDRQWRKEVLHLSGGSTNLQPSIARHLEEMGDTISSNNYGANVTTFYKESAQNIEVATSDRIFDMIRDGLGIITFFGHSGVTGFDFSLDNVENYENKGKYPFVMSLGCHSGNIHTKVVGISEKFVVQQDKGAIVFLAASGTAYITQQFFSGRNIYHRFGRSDYGKPIGDVVRNVIEKFSPQTGSSYVTFLQQLTLHGDPAVRLLQNDFPDIIPDANSVLTNPTYVDTYEDEFELCFDVANVGKFRSQEMDIFIEHLSPTGIVVTDTIIRDAIPSFRNSYCLKMPLSIGGLVGKNKINIIVDHANEIEEGPGPLAELNNTLVSNLGTTGFDFFILNNSAIPIYPEEYGIVNETNVKLVASTYNGLGEEQKFTLQIDTTKLFNSGLMREKVVPNVNGIAQWDLDFNLGADKTVYYWRISPDSTTTGVGYVWDESSFVYDPPAFDGWNQSHFYQFNENEFDKLNIDQNRDFLFAPNIREVLIANKVWASGDPAGFKINNTFFSSSMVTNTSPALGVVVLDTTGNIIMNPIGGDHGAINPRNKPIRTFYFKTDAQQSRIDFVNFLENIVPSRLYVCIYPVFKNINSDFEVSEWAQDSILNNGKNIYNTLESQGAHLIRQMEEKGFALPYGFIYRKDVTPLAEGILEELNDTDIIEVIESIPGFWFEGSMSTNFIGPSSNWVNVEWSVDENSNFDNDTTYLKIYGYDALQTTESLLFDKVESRDFDLSTIDATQYPFLKVTYYSKDENNVSPVQLKSLRVYYDGTGDLALNTTQNFEFHTDSIQQGDNIRLKFDLTNFSGSDVRASNITYTFTDSENTPTITTLPLEKIDSGASSTVEFSYNTKEFVGDYSLQIDVNAGRNPMERYYFNNFGAYEFKVYPDKTNPLMDVTFDGVHIMNDDIVSGNPLIRVELTDENPFLLLENQSDYTLTLLYPDGETKEILQSDPQLTFFPADASDNNSARLEYHPDLDIDGSYTLTVDATDVSNNSAGDRNYEVSFRVFNEEMVSNVFNYPNPFSTSTQFIFTLTGDEEPGNVLIRIMTMTGKVVREITMAELGQLRMGVNRTEYKWDGTDEFGDKLANGVYLYQVITKKLDGSDYKKYTDPNKNNTDYFFKKGFGKMVIMR